MPADDPPTDSERAFQTVIREAYDSSGRYRQASRYARWAALCRAEWARARAALPPEVKKKR